MDYDYGTQDSSTFLNESTSHDSFSRESTFEIDRNDVFSDTKDSTNSETNQLSSNVNTTNIADTTDDFISCGELEKTTVDDTENTLSVLDKNESENDVLQNDEKSIGFKNEADNNEKVFNSNSNDPEDVGCCGCNEPLMCFAFVCDCFGL